MTEGHDKPCYYCKCPCNSLAGNPGKWPVALTHADEPGVVKWHHVDCVSSRLAMVETLSDQVRELTEQVQGLKATLDGVSPAWSL